LFQLFATCVADTCGKFTAGVVTPAVPVAKFDTGVVDTSGAPGLRISQQFFGKIQNDPNAIFRGFGKDDS
jgi:hypothetical protein